MPTKILTPAPAARDASPLTTPQTARGRIAAGRFAAEAEVAVTPAGLLAIGGLVSAILLSVAPIILSARRRRGDRPPVDRALEP